MTRDGIFAGLCTFFLAGIAAGTLVAEGLDPASSPFLAVPFLLVILFLTARTSLSGRASFQSLAATFACAGAFCALASGCIPDAFRGFPLADLAVRSLREAIDSTPWPSPTSAPLVKALLTGDRSALSRDLLSTFRRSGASHILALSGLHLGVIYLILGKVLSVLGRFPPSIIARYVLILVFSAFYTIMTGASPSLVRAFLFILLRETAILLHRPRHPLRILLAAMVIQLASSPSVLSSTGFQLSYLAMAGITILYPRLLALWPDTGAAPLDRFPRKIWQAASLSISCQAFTAPLAWIRFHTLPAYFLITNLLALPLTFLIIILVTATILLSSLGIHPGLLVTLSDKALSLFLFILKVIAGM